MEKKFQGVKGHRSEGDGLNRHLLAIDITPMANRANRQDVIFVIENIENPIITDSETKFLPTF